MYSTAWCFRDSSVQLIGNPGEMYYGHRSALRNSERPLMLTVSETGGLLKNPKRREDIVIIVPNKDMNKYKEFLPPGEQMTSSGELCAFYYQGNSGRAEKR